MPEVIIAAVIGASGAIVAALLGIVPYVRSKRKQLGKVEGQTKRVLEELGSLKKEGTDITIKRQAFTLDLSSDGKLSVVRRELIRHIPGRPAVQSKKIAWVIDELEGYLRKTHKNLIDLDLDKEFGISVMDVRTKTFLSAKTIHEHKRPGQSFERLSTTFVFDNPLSDTNPDLEFQINYTNLDTSFAFRDFWETQNDFWYTECAEPLDELRVEILLPHDLDPTKWRQGDFGIAMTPPGWATASFGTREAKRLICFSAQNLTPGTEYKARIDGRLSPY